MQYSFWIHALLITGLATIAASEQDLKTQRYHQCVHMLLNLTSLPRELCRIIAAYDSLQLLEKIFLEEPEYIGNAVIIGDYIACARRTGTHNIQLLRIKDFSPADELPLPARVCSLIKFSEDVLASCFLGRKTIIFRNIVTKRAHPLRTASLARCLALVHEQLLAVGSESGRIRIYDTHDNNRCTISLLGHTAPVQCLTPLSPKLFASGSQDCSIKLWDMTSGLCTQTLTKHDWWVTHLLKLSEYTFASAAHGIIKTWDMRSNKFLYTLKAHPQWISCLTRLPELVFASGSHDKTVKLWDCSTGDLIETLDCAGPVQSLVCLPNKLVASVNNYFLTWEFEQEIKKKAALQDSPEYG